MLSVTKARDAESFEQGAIRWIKPERLTRNLFA